MAKKEQKKEETVSDKIWKWIKNSGKPSDQANLTKTAPLTNKKKSK